MSSHARFGSTVTVSDVCCVRRRGRCTGLSSGGRICAPLFNKSNQIKDVSDDSARSGDRVNIGSDRGPKYGDFVAKWLR